MGTVFRRNTLLMVGAKRRFGRRRFWFDEIAVLSAVGDVAWSPREVPLHFPMAGNHRPSSWSRGTSSSRDHTALAGRTGCDQFAVGTFSALSTISTSIVALLGTSLKPSCCWTAAAMSGTGSLALSGAAPGPGPSPGGGGPYAAPGTTAKSIV